MDEIKICRTYQGKGGEKRTVFEIERVSHQGRPKLAVGYYTHAFRGPEKFMILREFAKWAEKEVE